MINGKVKTFGVGWYIPSINRVKIIPGLFSDKLLVWKRKGNLCGINNSSSKLSAFAVSLTSAECGLGVCTSHCSQSSAQTLLLQGLRSLLESLLNLLNLRIELPT
jgi:hypothetical protein